MSDFINENELVEVAMQIILHAGDARLKIEKALDEVKEFNFMKAKEVLIEAEECIRQAHVAQTQIIQNETSGKTYEASLLFNHAQDTLMTIMSEEKIAKQMVEVAEVLYKEFKN
ncbi:PTS system cellobiose-specific IIA component [Breznakia sp. PF5-3]|uniref:PTS lactose/cellobiose transporter subunit IIA n=1 Tax=unclassified Breznakia TaxID=2623764 RepID=UPI002405D9E4|nr:MULTISPECIES: PTS lactose/cellobiose transporter subunit IIA [unclassified Breznakia]MDF9824810.1 PTS system cellobiose-specific IIA component [Breznakia sp. PM6-1]MDF9835734.1 PTS system cellobiose-specific IIA component [Breznakia sp. PF5-3]MDF9837820.1 PTS system cellobiose-specific IIA component [Breznakia sp. PFB2-8]MDF9859809.1 PTS system cellobiose-specific IIA component [Breznakia sp. PH5-24]